MPECIIARIVTAPHPVTHPKARACSSRVASAANSLQSRPTICELNSEVDISFAAHRRDSQLSRHSPGAAGNVVARQTKLTMLLSPNQSAFALRGGRQLKLLFFLVLL